MSTGDLIAVVFIAFCTLLAVATPTPKESKPFRPSFAFTFVISEWPAPFFLYLVAVTATHGVRGNLDGPVSWVGVPLAAATTIGLAVIVERSLRSQRKLDEALHTALGNVGSRTPTSRIRKTSRRVRMLFWPLPLLDPRVERIRSIPYGNVGRGNVLDLYRPRSRPADGPTLIYLHGGAFRMGSKNIGARPLMHRLARHGWVCISANYRISHGTTFPDQLIDLKRVIAWVRAHGVDYSADPNAVILAGGSSGGHLCATAALTEHDPQFQPGFEHADTSVSAAILLSAYLGPIDSHGPLSSPHDYVHPDAPPFFVLQAGGDTLIVPADARNFVDDLRSASSTPVVYCELPGAQHAFEMWDSIRFDAVIEAIETFATWVRRT